MSRVKALPFLSLVLSLAVFLSGITFYPSQAKADSVPLVPNGGFEQVANGIPLQWSVISGTAASSANQVHSGNYSVELSDSSSAAPVGLRSQKMQVARTRI
ncbi:hypothetical protein [Candidatus Pristimantibacillus sp. PTI5]|uniref:hypothetical protein n=1 Tax=Candidatus Pristimantibacillus sp. PTI5 TaxID=3400422 RepID=UPI003B01F4FF